MSSPFLFRLVVKGKKVQQNLIPVWAFKSGFIGSSPFPTKNVNLILVENIIDSANGADGPLGANRLTVCTHSLFAYRSLANKEIDSFDLYIKDPNHRQFDGDYKNVAIIRCREMTGSGMIPVDGDKVSKMSCEMTNTQGLQAVTLSFDSLGRALSFERT